MKIYTIETGFFKLDGGAMFGVVPKSMWQKLNPPDENNMCTWSMRCLLVEVDKKIILIDTGMGDKQDEKFRGHFYPHGNDTLLSSLKKIGFGKEDITDVILSHLHFDHCGGAVEKNENGILQLTFPNATYWSNQDHWNWAINPNEREKASFLKENFELINQTGHLKFIEQQNSIHQDISTPIVFGHTEAMMTPFIKYKNQTIVFAADLMPSSFHIPMPYVMAYDLRPLDTLKEKKNLLEFIEKENGVLFFEHDPIYECATLKKNEQGRIVVDQYLKISDL